MSRRYKQETILEGHRTTTFMIISVFNLFNIGGDQCPSPRPPQHGTVAAPAKAIVGSTAVYVCDPGYRLQGQSILTCLKLFFWSGFRPSCVPNYCPPPEKPDHGKVMVVGDRTLVGGVATFVCDPGFILEGPAVTVCKDGPYWDREPPACRRNSCWKPPNPENGLSVSGNPVPVGGVATFVCNPGYVLNGVSVMTCDRAGHWSEYLPSCDEIGKAKDVAKTPQDTQGDGVARNPTQGELTGKDTIVSIGNHDVRSRSDVRRGERVEYSENGERERPREITVSAIEQPRLRPVANAKQSNVEDPRLRKSSVAVLSSIGNQVECLSLQIPEHGSLKVSSYYPDGKAVYSCHNGYSLSGSSRRVCQADGIWSGQRPVCKPIMST